MKRRPCVWVVEMLGYESQWTPTDGLFASRSMAQWIARKSKRNNPDDRFRVVKYVREE